MKIRFEELTEQGVLFSIVTGISADKGLSVGSLYDVTNITETGDGRAVYHFIDDDGEERYTVLKGSLRTFSILPDA